jgi:hypothetical protein
MTNQEFIKSIEKEFTEKGSAIPEETKIIIENTLNKYGENKWWLSTDLKTIGYYQLFEDVLVVDFSKFHEGIEKLLGRPIWTHEFGLNLNKVREDAQLAWDGYIKLQSEIESDVTIGINTIIDYCEENNKPLIGIVK